MMRSPAPSNFTEQTLAWFDEGDQPEQVVGSGAARWTRFSRGVMLLALVTVLAAFVVAAARAL